MGFEHAFVYIRGTEKEVVSADIRTLDPWITERTRYRRAVSDSYIKYQIRHVYKSIKCTQLSYNDKL